MSADDLSGAGSDPAEGPEGPPRRLPSEEEPQVLGPERPWVSHSLQVSRARAAARRKRPKPGSKKAEEAYRSWAQDVLTEVPAGWTAAERAAHPEVRALRQFSAQLPDAALALKTVAIEPERVEDEVVTERLRTIQRLKGWLGAQEAETVNELSRRRTGLRQLYVAEELAACLSLSGYSAGKLAARAEALGEFTEVHQALRAGRLDERKTDALIEGTQTLPGAQARAVHRALLPIAEALTAAQLRKRIAAAVIAVDPAQARERHEKARATRTVALTPAKDGMAWISAFLPAPEAVAAFTAIDALAGRQGADDDRPVGARRADAFGQVFTETLNSGYTPGGCALGSRQGVRPHLIVTVALATLTGADDAPAHLEGYGPIDATTAREISENGDIGHVAYTDAATGTMVGLDRRKARAHGRRRSNGAASGADGVRVSSNGGSDDGKNDDDGADGEEVSASSASPAAKPRGAPSQTAKPRGAPSQAAGAHTADPQASRPHATGPRATDLHAHDPYAVMGAIKKVGNVDPVAWLSQVFGMLATDSYAPSAALRAFIVARDRTCRFPGCEQPGTRCQIDHIDPYTTDLPAWAQTIASNLQLLCTRHHQMKTSGAWQVGRDRDGTTRWISPGGQHYERAPEVIDPAFNAQWARDAMAEVSRQFGDRTDALGPKPLDPGTAEGDNPANLAANGASLEEIRRKLVPDPDPASNPETHSRDHHQVTEATGAEPEPPGSTQQSAPISQRRRTPRRRMPHRSSEAAGATEGSESDDPPF